MGVAIQCILENPVPGIPQLDGKALAMAYCGDATVAGHDSDLDKDEEDVGRGQIIAVDFGGTHSPRPSSESTWSEPLLAALDPFIVGEDACTWRDPSEGLVAVRAILEKLRSSEAIEIDADFDLGEAGNDDLISGVIYDLETLESILSVAQSARIRFYLTFDV